MVQTSYLSELAQSANAGAQALVVITFEGQALSIVREAIDEGIYNPWDSKTSCGPPILMMQAS